MGSPRSAVEEGEINALSSPSGDLSIIDEHGRLIAAANIVAEMTIETWLPDATKSPIHRAIAQLVFTAFHQWRHRMSAT